MKFRPLLIFIILFTYSCSAQTPLQMVKNCRQKSWESLLASATFPFRMDVGSTDPKNHLRDSTSLRKACSMLTRQDFFNNIKKGKIKRLAENRYSIEIRNIQHGELQSESDYIFEFKKIKGRWRWCSLTLAG